MTEKVIYDCDNTMGLPFKEVDDGLTILFLLGLKEVELLGITTTFGNGTIGQVYQQTTKLVKQLGIHIPVIRGEGKRSQSPDTPAAHFLVEMVNQHPQQISLLVTGPVGNLHAAAQIDPGFFTRVKQVLLMGGYRQPLKLGYRNLPELNFSANPEAVCKVLSAPCPVTVFPAQACLDAPFTSSDINNAQWWNPNFRAMLKRWLWAFGLYCGVRVFYLWDLLPAVYLVSPDLFDTERTSLSITLENLQNGSLVPCQSNDAESIILVNGINNRPAFYQQLERSWRHSARLFPPKKNSSLIDWKIGNE